MISDVLSEAVWKIDQYLQDQPIRYSGDLRQRIVAVRDAMDAMRSELDTPDEALSERMAEQTRRALLKVQT